MSVARCAVLGSCLLAAVLAVCGIALAAKTYPDPAGDVSGGRGPDILSVRMSNTGASITFRVRFAEAPPLRADPRRTWADMLLIGLDVPPFGKLPVAPGREWPGANFALGTHGPSATGQLIRLGTAARSRSHVLTTFRIVTRGPTVTFSIPVRLLGSPRRLTVIVAVAREGQEGKDGGVDLMPARGTLRYSLT